MEHINHMYSTSWLVKGLTKIWLENIGDILLLDQTHDIHVINLDYDNIDTF